MTLRSTQSWRSKDHSGELVGVIRGSTLVAERTSETSDAPKGRALLRGKLGGRRGTRTLDLTDVNRAL